MSDSITWLLVARANDEWFMRKLSMLSLSTKRQILNHGTCSRWWSISLSFATFRIYHIFIQSSNGGMYLCHCYIPYWFKSLFNSRTMNVNRTYSVLPYHFPVFQEGTMCKQASLLNMIYTKEELKIRWKYVIMFEVRFEYWGYKERPCTHLTYRPQCQKWSYTKYMNVVCGLSSTLGYILTDLLWF